MRRTTEHGEEEGAFEEVLAPVRHATRLTAIAAVGLAAAASFLALWQRVGLPFDVIGLAATLVGGWPIWMEAWEAVRERQINMEITMALGVAAALVIGQFATAAIIVAFTLFSMYLEDLTKSRGRRALEALMRAAPEAAFVQRGSEWERVAPETVQVGELVRIRPGEKVPVDGVVREGRGSITEAAITGEPFPQEKEPGSSVWAGTVNGSSMLVVHASKAAKDSTYARIVALVREATERRGKTQRLADRLAQGIVYIVLAAAVVTFIATRNLTSTISVILVAGACGVAAGTPLAILATSARAARRGVVMKGGEAIEALARVDTILFDKTGTLTLGKPVVHAVFVFDESRRGAMLDALSAVEAGSDHPIARAIVEAHPTQARASDVAYVAGRGVRGVVRGKRVLAGNLAFASDHAVKVPSRAWEEEKAAAEKGRAVVFCALDGEVVGGVVLADVIRPEAKSAVARLRGMDLDVIMLTGDQPAPARAVAADLGIVDVRAGLLPEDKIQIVEELKASGRRVCFVGDGINDAPALAASHASVAVRSGSEAAVEASDVLLMNNDLASLVDAIESSRKSQRVIMFNFGGTLAVDFVGIGLASFGLLTPLLAALVHVGSELLFILNSARLFAAADVAATAASPSPSIS